MSTHDAPRGEDTGPDDTSRPGEGRGTGAGGSGAGGSGAGTSQDATDAGKDDGGADEDHRDLTRPAPSGSLGRGSYSEGIRWTATWTARVIVLAVGAVLAGLLLEQLWSIVLPVLLALIVTSVLEPPARLLERRLHLPGGLAALLVIVVGVAALAGSVALLAPTASDQVVQLALSASDGLTEIERWVQSSGLGVTDSQIETAVAAVQQRLQSSASSIASGVLVGLSAVANALVNLIITLVLVFFFLKDGRRFTPWVDRWTSPNAGRHLVAVSTRAWTTLGTFVRTQALVGAIDAVFIGAGLLIIGVPLALPLAFLTFLAAFAPIVGAVTVGALAVLVALASNGWVAALLVLGVVLLVQQLEGNVLLPWLQGRSLDLHAGVVLLAIVLGSTLFGVVGAFLSVPTAAVAVVVARYLHEQTRVVAEEDVRTRARQGTGSDPES